MSEHIVRSYDADLQELRRLVSEMGRISDRMLGDATLALANGDTALAESVVNADTKLDALQREIEETAIHTIARRQPLASDLREVISAMPLASDLERVGDLAKNIAKRVSAVAGQIATSQKAMVGIEHMSQMVQTQLKDVLDAYSRNDEVQALDVWNRDELIDALYTSLFRELLTYMMQDSRNINLCIHLLFCAKNIERIGDHTTNIAEIIHYLVKGTVVEGVRAKGDNTNILSTPADHV